jgi:four helix bundle protein
MKIAKITDEPKIMAKITSFEELDVWKKARELENRIFQFTFDSPFSRDFGLRDQVNRSTGSVMDNIAEGFGRGSKKEFIHFLIYAQGSCSEVKSQLYRTLDRKYISQPTFESLYDVADHTARMIAKLITHLKKSEFDGLRYKDI